MTMDKSIQDVVFQLLAEKMSVEKDWTLEKSVNYDIGMDGDDAVEFFEDFAERFQVVLTALAEEWDRYFAPEGVSLSFDCGEILTLFTAKERTSHCKKIPLPLSRIIAAAEQGRWVKEEEEK